MKKKIFRLSILGGALLLVFLLTGCGNGGGTENTDIDTSSVQENQADTAQEDDYSSPDAVVSSDGENRTVIMMGRSVMYSWFEHWGAEDGEYQKGRFALEYQELDSPPGITKSVEKIMKKLPADKKDVVFFKFCFVDFEGEGGASTNLEQNKKYIEEVYRIVVEEHDAKLIIGNALPQVMNDNDIYLVWNHQQYNAWLKKFWQEHPENVTVFNMYKQLSDDVGALNEDYAVDEYDSHLNKEGYKALDKPFWEMMESLY
ncbi:MAG: SGNH/GDSL hydrolase family protein [Parcubacteria group bacterium]|nr:SGNH/GDSL hydrolase family protein [Parcubacteria group bacterium]